MKKQLKNSIQTLVLGSILACPLSSQARLVSNINQSMTDLLGHAPSVTNIYIADHTLNKGSPQFQPWSSSYWPDMTGGIANHYRDRSFLPNLVSFMLRYGVASKRFHNDFENVTKKYDKWSPDELNQKLSASEKYDLLLGDTKFGFTKAVIDDIDFRAKHRKTSVMADGREVDPVDDFEGDDNTGVFADVQETYARFEDKISYKYWKEKGNSIAYWFGICDGWSPASVTLPRPENPVTVTGALGHQITFYPDDLKALGSYLFARTNNDFMTTMNYHFAGRACASGGTPDQKDNGIVKDIRCNDLDAGVWHLTLLNRIGMDKMGFVFEIDNNKKINNHPVSSYELKYFSPITGKEASLLDSVVPIKSVKDAYAARRHPEAVYLVGVKSKFRYLNYQFAEKHHRSKWEHDSAGQDEYKDKEYTYDLELDLNGAILGGEWGNRAEETVRDDNGRVFVKAAYADQPDFIWMAAPQNLPYSQMSVFTTLGTFIDPSNPRPFGNVQWNWDGKTQLPEDWMRAAKRDALWQEPIVGKLVELGNKQKTVEPANAKDSTMKSAQLLSNIVYYLFDQSRNPNQK